MKEIKFRGKSIRAGAWVYGCLVNNMWAYSELSKFKKGSPVCEIITGNYESDCWEEAITEDSNIITVFPETVGQYTGLIDKHGKDIYEGDIIKATGDVVGVLTWNNWMACWSIRVESDTESAEMTPYSIQENGRNIKREVIGNIHENPELLR
jgi:uncharacterized phage protein (TIGR01671 family)